MIIDDKILSEELTCSGFVILSKFRLCVNTFFGVAVSDESLTGKAIRGCQVGSWDTGLELRGEL